MSREQLYSQIHNATPKEVKVYHIMNKYSFQHYMSNGVQEIECVDKNGNAVKLTNSPRIEMRIIDNKNKKHDFYFDTIHLNDSTFTGMNSRILATQKSIRYSEIRKVKLQDGGKKYNYADLQSE